MISFVLPRFVDQSLDRSRKERFYPGADAVDGEARHRDPRAVSHRPRPAASDGSSAKTAPTRPTATVSSFSSRSRTWSRPTSTAVLTLGLRIPAARLRHARTRFGGILARRSARFRRSRNGTSSAPRRSRSARQTAAECWWSRFAVPGNRRATPRRTCTSAGSSRRSCPGARQSWLARASSGRLSADPEILLSRLAGLAPSAPSVRRRIYKRQHIAGSAASADPASADEAL